MARIFNTRIGRTIICLSIFFVWAISAVPAESREFTLATYNVENLFDLHRDQTEYDDYIPGGSAGWNQEMLSAKLEHTATVLSDLAADVAALQEIESPAALSLLVQALKQKGADYPYAAISGQRDASVRCALLSIFPITSVTEIAVPGRGTRNILKAAIDIDGRQLIIYVNHWKSKTGPESRRLVYASALLADMKSLPVSADVVLAGDFNSDYNEFETFARIKRLNDTNGITGINHILGTLKNSRMVEEAQMFIRPEDRAVYNLWLELPPHQRWSVDFYGRKNSPDSIIVSKGLYDGSGIAYVDNSFDKFDPQYLFQDDRIYRWQRADKGKGRHLGKGYSDHLPVFARFTTQAYKKTAPGALLQNNPEEAAIADLYQMNPGSCSCRLRECRVIYRSGDHAVIKQEQGRAIYIYGSAGKLQIRGIYDLTVVQLARYHGNMEIHAVTDVRKTGSFNSLDEYCIDPGEIDLSDPGLRNEIVCRVEGEYKNGWLYYSPGRKIRIYFSDPALAPKEPGKLCITSARINYHDHPELLVEHEEQLSAP